MDQQRIFAGYFKGWSIYEMQKAGVAELGAEKRYDQGVYKQEGSAEDEGEGVPPDSPVAEQGSV